MNANVGRLLDQYGEHVDARNKTLSEQGKQLIQPTAPEFFQWIAPVYVNDPRVQQTVKDEQARQRKTEEERIRAEERAKFAQAEKEKLAEAAQRHSGRPPSTSSHSSSGNIAALTEEQRTVMTGANRRTAIRKGIAQRYGNR